MSTRTITSSEREDSSRVCPPRHVILFDNFLRPLFHDPRKLFSPYVQPGMTALDIGCGRGFASLGLAELVGAYGRVIAADLQEEMLDMVDGRAHLSGLQERIDLHRCQPDRIGIATAVDFALAFWMVHETPDSKAFLQEVLDTLKPGGNFFVAEPKMHVKEAQFERMICDALEIGFEVVCRPRVRLSRAVVLHRK